MYLNANNSLDDNAIDDNAIDKSRYLPCVAYRCRALAKILRQHQICSHRVTIPYIVMQKKF